MTWPVGYMVWRIGDLLDFDAQVAWMIEHRFEAIGFHSAAGDPGQWRGLDPLTADALLGRDLKRLLHDHFQRIEIHAPFAILLRSTDCQSALQALQPTLDLAHDLAVDVITLHAIPPAAKEPRSEWRQALAKLEAVSAQADVTVALECLSDQPWFSGPATDHVGVNLDIGHMYQSHLGSPDPNQGVIEAIQTAGPALAHIHFHDVRGERDHVALGAGDMDHPAVCQALAEARYSGFLNLELNPDVVSPQDLLDSRDRLAEMVSGL